ncbi:hypothetical protein IWQ62_002388 [Dispira parvispora]|uniref:Uncharacterized protein n=1 Tax=Dispira parvispora TaxID=1520584 RepID=A0A9W8AQH2_9FUNG|nr:hypothetical protein IWQ62_002388 [Dispira parvispora]
MKVSILGWSVLTYLLAFSPGLLSNEDPVCQELREVMTAEELKSPHGLIAKIVCPSLETESTPLNAIEEIQSLGHDELLSLCSTELRQLGYMIGQKHQMAVRDMKESYKRGRPITYSIHHLSPEAQTSSFPFADERYEKLETLPIDLSPIAPIRELWITAPNFHGFYYSDQHFIQSTTGLPQSQMRRDLINLQQLSGKDLLDFSPMNFLSIYKRPKQAIDLTSEVYGRADEAEFHVAFRRALGVVAEAYPMYFITKVGDFIGSSWGYTSPLAENIKRATRFIFNHNLYVGLLSIGDEGVISNLINELAATEKYWDELHYLFKEALTLPSFDPRFVFLSLMYPEVYDESDVFDYIDAFKSQFGNETNSYRKACDKYGGMVAKFRNSKISYANITISDV